MKDFREAHPTPDSLDDVGVRRLSAAIILQAAEDYYYIADRYFKNSSKHVWRMQALFDLEQVEQFTHSALWNSITDMSADHFRRTILDWRRHGKSIPNFIGKWRGRLEEDDQSTYSDYYEPGYLTNLLNDPRFLANYINLKRTDLYV